MFTEEHDYMKNMNRVHDLTGQKSGRLTVLEVDLSKQTRKTYWICQCDCGNIVSVRSDRIISGRSKSCGCYKNELSAERVAKNHTHKQSHTKLHNTWLGMKSRCYNKNNDRYEQWGGRGITVCDEWKNDFVSFYKWSLENGYSEELTIDRIDNDGNYEPNNCRWTNQKQQSRNRRTNINITIGNSTKTLTEWCEIFNLPYKTINARYHRQKDIGIEELFKPIPR